MKDNAEGTDNKSDKECSDSDKEKISSTEIRETSEDGKRDDEKFDETAEKSVVRKRSRRARDTIENVVA